MATEEGAWPPGHLACMVQSPKGAYSGISVGGQVMLLGTPLMLFTKEQSEQRDPDCSPEFWSQLCQHCQVPFAGPLRVHPQNGGSPWSTGCLRAIHGQWQQLTAYQQCKLPAPTFLNHSLRERDPVPDTCQGQLPAQVGCHKPPLFCSKTRLSKAILGFRS